MNFNVYIDKRTGEQLARLAKARRTSRNALIREALAHLLNRGTAAGWPDVVLAFMGIASTPRFEDHRRKLTAPSEDPLA